MRREANVVIGLFAGREAADRPLKKLHHLRFAGVTLDTAAAPPGSYLLDSDFRGPMRTLWRATVVGALAGACAGPGLIALAPGVFAAFGPAVLVVGFLGGVLWGALAGSWFGFPSEAIAGAAYHDRWHEIPAGAASVLVVARTTRSVIPVREALAHAGALGCLDARAPLPERAEPLRRAA